MNRLQIDGMRARSLGSPRQANPHPALAPEHAAWQFGWELMDQQIGQLLSNAEGMLDGIRRLRDTSHRHPVSISRPATQRALPLSA